MHRTSICGFHRGVLATVALGSLGASALAGPLNPKLVSGDAKWLVHIDIEAALKCSIVDTLRSSHELGEAGIDEFKKETGLDPFTDIKDITLYGFDGDSDRAVFLAQTTAAADKTVEKVKALKSFKTVASGAYQLLCWNDDEEGDGDHAGGAGKDAEKEKDGEDGGHHHKHGHEDDDSGLRYAYVHSPAGGANRIVVFGENADDVARGVDVLTAKKPGLGAGGAIKPAPKAGVIFYAVAADLSEIMGLEANVAKQAESMELQVGEAGGELFADAAVQAKTAEDATSITQVVQGIIAMGRLAAGEEPELKELMPLVDSLKMSAQGKMVTASFRYDTKAITEKLKKAIDEEQAEDGAKQPARKEHHDEGKGGKKEPA